jgi:hypothetical protein
VVTMGPLEFGVRHVGWSEDGQKGEHLIVSRGRDDPDYCLITQSGTTYGGVTRCQVSDGKTELSLSEAAARLLGTETHIRIEYPEDAAPADELVGALSQLGVEPVSA